MTQPYKASSNLESFVLNQAPRHHPACDAPDSYAGLVAWNDAAKVGDSMPVYDGGSHNTIYSHARYNYAFRAWHDRIHINLGLKFTLVDEIKVSNEHARQMASHRVMFGLSTEDSKAMRADVAGQVMYYYKYGEYVRDQALFVGACMESTIFLTLASGVRY